MCEYCEGKKAFEAECKGDGILTMKMNMNFLFGGGSNNIAHIEDRIMYVDNSSGEYAELGFRINYCPNCGEKIRDEGITNV